MTDPGAGDYIGDTGDASWQASFCMYVYIVVDQMG